MKNNQLQLEVGEAQGVYLIKDNKKYLWIFGDYIEVTDVREALNILEKIDEGYKRWDNEAEL